MIAGGRQPSHLASSSLNMFHVGNKNPMKMFPIGNIAAECKCKVKSPAVDRLRGDLKNKQLGNYDAVLILLPKTIVEHNTRKQNDIKRMLEQVLSKGLGKMVVVTYCYDSHRS